MTHAVVFLLDVDNTLLDNDITLRLLQDRVGDAAAFSSCNSVSTSRPRLAASFFPSSSRLRPYWCNSSRYFSKSKAIGISDMIGKSFVT